MLFDENNWKSDDLQNFTYSLCKAHATGNMMSTYPALVHYAHSAAMRGRALLGKYYDDNASIISGRCDFRESEILINEFHNLKLYFF